MLPLMVLWRSGYAAVCKTAYAGSIPAGTSMVPPSGGIGIRGGLKIRSLYRVMGPSPISGTT